MKHAALILLLVALVGCSMVESHKYVIYEKDSVNLHPMQMRLGEADTEGGSNEMVLPDGTYVTLDGTGSAGNLYLITNQNDGTSQVSKGQVEAEVSPTVTGQGTATTEKTDAGSQALEGASTGGSAGPVSGDVTPEEPSTGNGTGGTD